MQGKTIIGEQWLVDLLKGKNILSFFCLKRIQYLKIDSNIEGCPIWWVCEHHWKEGIDRGTVKNYPFLHTKGGSFNLVRLYMPLFEFYLT
jgi:hypothetical protein